MCCCSRPSVPGLLILLYSALADWLFGGSDIAEQRIFRVGGRGALPFLAHDSTGVVAVAVAIGRRHTELIKLMQKE